MLRGPRSPRRWGMGLGSQIPQPVGAWSGVLDTQEMGEMCSGVPGPAGSLGAGSEYAQNK